jgi:hypothetical protein
MLKIMTLKFTTLQGVALLQFLHADTRKIYIDFGNVAT